VLVGKLRASNGTVLALGVGNYNLTTIACAGFHLDSWVVSGGVSVSGAVLTVAGPGTLTGLFVPIFPSVALSTPPSVFAGNAVNIEATVAVQIPPYNYSYAWNFGDGSSVKTPANFTSHTYQTPGTFVVSVSVTDPYGRVANASQTLVVLSTNGGNGIASLPAVLWVGLGILVVVALILVLGSRYRRPPASSDDGGSMDSGPPALPEGTDNPPIPDPQP
jgi:PKD repeat protein